MKTFLLLVIALPFVSFGTLSYAETEGASPNSSANAQPIRDAAKEATTSTPDDAAQFKNTQMFEQELIGSIWNFPWDGRQTFIEFLPDHKLKLGWNIHYRGYKWRVPKIGVVELHIYMDGHTFDTLRIPPNLISAALNRGDRQIAIISRRY